MTKQINHEFKERLYAFICAYKTENGGIPPSYREMMAHMKSNSSSYIRFYLMKLVDEGRIMWRKGNPRDIRVVGEVWRRNAQ